MKGIMMRRVLVFAVLAALAAVIWAKWPQRQPAAVATAVGTGPKIILFRGDDSANCRAIHRLVDEAETRYGSRIEVVKVDWSRENPLIQEHKVRFLPTVVFIDRAGRERKRTIGESTAAHADLKQALDGAETTLLE